MDETWGLVPQTRLVWHDYGPETLVYNELSGATHLVDSATARLLQLLEQAPLTTSQLSQRLGAAFQSSHAEIAEWLPETLEQFKRQGLACIINQ